VKSPGIEPEAQRRENSSNLLMYDSVVKFYFGTRTLLQWGTILGKGMLRTQITFYKNFETKRDIPRYKAVKYNYT